MAYISSFKGQNWLIPQSIKDMIPQNHICFFVEEFVESLDFSRFDMINEGPGHPSYHPRILMKILLQGMLSKERSSRKIASASRENFVFMYLAEKVNPDFRTICRFRKDNTSFIKEVFKETIKLASDNNLIDLSLICVDGTKIKANANRNRCVKREQVDQLDSIIDTMIKEDIMQDELDEDAYKGKEENLTSLDNINLKEIVKTYRNNKNKTKLVKEIKKVKKEFEEDPKTKAISLTDPECRMMQNKKGVFEFGYNAQITVDSKNQIILANDVCQDRNDLKQLKPQIEDTKENIELKKDTKVGADAGYSSGKNFKFLEDEKLEGYIPTNAREFSKKKEISKRDDYEYDWEKDEIILKGVRLKYRGTYYYKRENANYRSYFSEDRKKRKFVPEFFRSRLRMKEKMETEKAREIYNKRQIVVEPPIGNIKQNLGFREFSLRGLDNVKIELNLVSIVHNLKKIWVARGEISHEEKKLVFYLILYENYLDCGTACKPNLNLFILNILYLFSNLIIYRARNIYEITKKVKT